MQVVKREVDPIGHLVVSATTEATTAAMTVPKEPEILECILKFRSPEIPRRIAQKAGIPTEKAEELFVETLKYLYVCRQARKARISVAPSLILDDGWHNFILFTKEYARFCKEYVGEFIHHVPDIGEPNQERYVISRQVAESLLGPLDSAIWPEAGMADCCQSIPPCSSCQPPCGSDGDE